jgi:nucleoside-diphosphate-sugar epimerase
VITSILVGGASGFIGAYLATVLIRKWEWIVADDPNPEYSKLDRMDDLK